MELRKEKGASLALTVTCTVFILLVGIGLFLVMQMVGGGREAQHATDAGNLNVAKQALKSPSISPGIYNDSVTGQTINQSVEYAGLLDTTPSGPNQIDLAIYNRLVGKAFIVACNASAEGTPQAYAAAQAVLDSVEGPGGSGQQLATALQQGSGTQNFFNALAFGNSLRMLNWNQQSAQTTDTNPNNYNNYQVSYLRQNQGAPTNLQLINTGTPASPQINVIPPAALSNITANYSASSTNTNNSNLYLSGYTPIGIKEGGTTLTVYGVPMRPGLEPHTVSQEQFTAEQTSPLVSGGNSLIPPNAFQSQWGVSQMQNASLLSTRSSAVVGTLAIQAPAAIPQGYIAINNSGPVLSDTYSSTGANVFSGELMGNGVYIMTAAPSGNVYFSTNSGSYSAVTSLPTSGTDGNGNPLVTGSLPPGTLSPNNPTGADLDSLYAQLAANASPVNCNNTNSFVNVNPTCANLVGQIQSELLQSGTSTTNSANDLMAIEYIKAQIIAVRGSFDGYGCGTINGNPPCTGLKQYTLSATNAVPFGSTGTLAQLLSEGGDSSNSIYNQLVQRMYEINPNAQASDISAAMNLQVPFEAGSSTIWQYLYWNGSAFVISTSPPPGGGSTPDTTADGTVINELAPVQVTNDVLVDVDSDGGYPHPFDCEPGNANANNQVNWTPSSGEGNLLGVLQFQNCASAGTSWCCPC